jgi:hypothetical protein
MGSTALVECLEIGALPVYLSPLTGFIFAIEYRLLLIYHRYAV